MIRTGGAIGDGGAKKTITDGMIRGGKASRIEATTTILPPP